MLTPLFVTISPSFIKKNPGNLVERETNMTDELMASLDKKNPFTPMFSLKNA